MLKTVLHWLILGDGPLGAGIAMARGPQVSRRIARLASGEAGSTSLPRLQRAMIGWAGACIVLAALMATPATLAVAVPITKDLIFVPAIDAELARRGTEQIHAARPAAVPKTKPSTAQAPAQPADGDFYGVALMAAEAAFKPADVAPPWKNWEDLGCGSTTARPTECEGIVHNVMCKSRNSNAENCQIFMKVMAINYEAGTRYLTGKGDSPRDSALALKHFRMSAEGGFSPAMLSLAQLLEGDQGVPRDKAKSDYWYRRWADTGDEIYTPEYRAQMLTKRNIR